MSRCFFEIVLKSCYNQSDIKVKQGGCTMAEIKPITLRIPMELHEKIKELADKEKRSVNSQVIYLLEKALSDKSE